MSLIEHCEKCSDEGKQKVNCLSCVWLNELGKELSQEPITRNEQTENNINNEGGCCGR